MPRVNGQREQGVHSLREGGTGRAGAKRFVGSILRVEAAVGAIGAAVDQKIKALLPFGHKYCCCCCYWSIRSVKFNAKRAATMCEPVIKR